MVKLNRVGQPISIEYKMAHGLNEAVFSCSAGARPKTWLILGVGLTHLVQSRDPFFLEAEVVDKIFQLDVLKNVRQIKSYDDMFQAIRALIVQKILKIRILS